MSLKPAVPWTIVFRVKREAGAFTLSQHCPRNGDWVKRSQKATGFSLGRHERRRCPPISPETGPRH